MLIFEVMYDRFNVLGFRTEI